MHLQTVLPRRCQAAPGLAAGRRGLAAAAAGGRPLAASRRASYPSSSLSGAPPQQSTPQCDAFTGPASLLPACPACRKQLPVQRMLDFDFLCGGCCWAELPAAMRFYRAHCGVACWCVSSATALPFMAAATQPTALPTLPCCSLPGTACRPQDAVCGSDRAAWCPWRLSEVVFRQGGDCHPSGTFASLLGPCRHASCVWRQCRAGPHPAVSRL